MRTAALALRSARRIARWARRGWCAGPDELEPALARALASGRPAVVNVAIEGLAAPTFGGGDH